MKFFASIFFCFLLSLAVAQPTQGDPNGGNPPGVPISGIEYLLGAGVLYGLKKMLKKDKNDK